MGVFKKQGVYWIDYLRRRSSQARAHWASISGWLKITLRKCRVDTVEGELDRDGVKTC